MPVIDYIGLGKKDFLKSKIEIKIDNFDNVFVSVLQRTWQNNPPGRQAFRADGGACLDSSEPARRPENEANTFRKTRLRCPYCPVTFTKSTSKYRHLHQFHFELNLKQRKANLEHILSKLNELASSRRIFTTPKQFFVK